MSDKINLKKRYFIISSLSIAALLGIEAKLFSLQVVNRKKYLNLSDRNRITYFKTQAKRGLIKDRNNIVIATNIPTFNLIVIPKVFNPILFQKLQKIIPIDSAIIKKIKYLNKHNSYKIILLASNISWEDVSKISILKSQFPGLLIRRDSLRYYPYGEIFAHDVGYVSISDIRYRPLKKFNSLFIGKSGLEKSLNKTLVGKSGIIEFEVDAKHNIRQQINSIKPINGQNVSIFLDANVQNYALSRLKHAKQIGSVVVMEIKTGNLIAMISAPSFNPNELINISYKNWKKLLATPHDPLLNRTISGLYNPGSIFKINTAMSALRSNISPKHTVVCKGYIIFHGRYYYCWKRSGHGRLDMVGAIRESCDVWFYTISQLVGIDKIAKTAKILGLGTKYDKFNLPAQKAGVIPNKKWKLDHIGKPWYLGETLISSIGQGYVQTTPLQLVIMISRLISNKKIVPNIVNLKKNNTYESINLKQKHIDVILHGMMESSNYPKGTSFASRLKGKWQMGGKTGTSQVVSLIAGQREINQHLIPWKNRDHALYVAFAPVRSPKYVTSVVLEHGISGAGYAAPIAHDIMQFLEDNNF